MHWKLEQKLTKLESSGTVTKVEQPDWGTPIVLVINPNGSITICVDYKITINKVKKFPIPRLAAQFGINYFCILDISNVSLHLNMNEEHELMQR